MVVAARYGCRQGVSEFVAVGEVQTRRPSFALQAILQFHVLKVAHAAISIKGVSFLLGLDEVRVRTVNRRTDSEGIALGNVAGLYAQAITALVRPSAIQYTLGICRTGKVVVHIAVEGLGFVAAVVGKPREQPLVT